MSNMKKCDIEIRSANENCWTHGVPAINVKWHPYIPDLVAKFKDVQATSRCICRACGQSGRKRNHDAGKQGHKFIGGGLYHVHEFGDDLAFWDWVQAMDRTTHAVDYPNGAFAIAEQLARDIAWEDAHDEAYEVWGSKAVQIYSSGRSGGWLVVHGLGDVEDWDAIELARWTRFQRSIAAIRDECDSSFCWHLHENVYEPIHNLQGVI